MMDGQRVFFKEPLIVDSVAIYNPTDEQMLSQGWQVWVEPAPTLEEVKASKIAEIEAYDSSEAVNVFYIGNQALWLDKATRTGLNFSLAMEESVGKTESTLWYGTVCFTLPISTFKAMLVAVELYAKECYNVTAQHMATVSKMETKEDVEDYDYTQGYPDKVSFEL